VRSAVAGGAATWIGYRVPIAKRERATMSNGDSCCGRCRLEPPSELVVLARAEKSEIIALKSLSADCDVDAAGMPVVWLTDVKPDESVAWLTSLAGSPASGPRSQTARAALDAIALHETPAAVRTLIALARGGESSSTRGQALFWLAQRAGDQVAATIADAIDRDPDTEVKKKAVFALSQLPADQGVPKLIDVAKANRNPAVRKQAMFWLGQSNDPRALRFFEETLLK
jgi:HEAT repeats